MSWLYEDRAFSENDIGDNVGFVYLITNKTTNKKYIGKKLFQFTRRKKVKGKARRTVHRFQSDWEQYYGSNEELNTLVEVQGKDTFERKILHLCKTRAQCSYYEAYEIFTRNALISEDYYNGWISCRIRKEHLCKKK